MDAVEIADGQGTAGRTASELPWVSSMKRQE